MLRKDVITIILQILRILLIPKLLVQTNQYFMFRRICFTVFYDRFYQKCLDKFLMIFTQNLKLERPTSMRRVTGAFSSLCLNASELEPVRVVQPFCLNISLYGVSVLTCLVLSTGGYTSDSQLQEGRANRSVSTTSATTGARRVYRVRAPLSIVHIDGNHKIFRK